MMLGRQPERAQIEGLLDSIESGPAGLALEGAPGIGKTTVWREAVEAGRRRGYAIIVTAPGEPDVRLAFAGLADLIDEVPEPVLGALPQPQRRALRAAVGLDDARAAPSADQQTLARSVLSLLRTLAAEAPLLVAIDDEQWLDHPSARVLGFALNRLRTERVLVLLARRARSQSALWPQIARSYAGTGMGLATLEPLDEATLGALLRAEAGRSLPWRVLARIHAVSGGNPLYAVAIVRNLPDGVPRLREIEIPRTLTEAISARLRALPPRTADVLAVAAASSQPTPALLQAVVPGFVLDDLESAVRADVIELTGERIRFTHPLLASTHYAATSTSRRRELHRALAYAATDDVERGRHLALAADAPDAEVAREIERAAETAARRGAPEASAELFEEAIRLTPVDRSEELWARRLGAARQRYTLGDAAHAEEALGNVMRDLPSGPLRAQALQLLALVGGTDDFQVALPLLEQAVTDAGEDAGTRTQIELELSALHNNLGDFAASTRWASSAAASAAATGDAMQIALARVRHATAAAMAGEAIDCEPLKRGVMSAGSDDRPTAELPSRTLGEVLFWCDDLDAARPFLEQAAQRALERDEELERQAVIWLLAFLEWHAGNLDACERHRRSNDDAIEIGGDNGLFWTLWFDAWFAAGRGALQDARRWGEEGLESVRRSGSEAGAIPMAMVLAAVDLWSGNAEAAHERVHAVREAALARGFGLVGAMTLGLWSCDVEALVALRRLDEAEAVLGDLIERVHRAGNPHAVAIAYRCRGLVLVARGEIDAAVEAMNAALGAHELRPLPAEVGRTWLEQGSLQRRAKRKREAERSLLRAVEILEPLRAEMWLLRARDELARIGLRRQTPADGLTPAQLRVAEMVVGGASNREIAGALHMSQRSVEAHLTKIYAHFGVRSRAQLSTRLATEPGRSAGPLLVPGAASVSGRPGAPR